MHKLEVDRFSLSFRGRQTLKSVSMFAPEGTVVALIGPSGCGKSTLLRSLNRMHDFNPDVAMQGKVLLDGADLYAPGIDVLEVRRKVGMVFQKPNPFPKSILENIAYGLNISSVKISQAEKSEISRRVLEESALWEEVHDKLHTSALELSGGQQQRLCIARAIAVDPEVLLMDEPCSALDPISTAKVESLIRKLKEKVTIVIVTHNMQQAVRVADYTGFMYLGEMIEFDTTDTIFNRPRTELVKRYVEGNFG